MSRGKAVALTASEGRTLLRAVVRVYQLLSCLVVTLVAGCGFGGGGEGWKKEVEMQTAQLGYRNWIVIAEASFPAHSRAGIRQVNSYQPIPVVVDEVLRKLELTEHVRPKVYVPKELRVIENDFAPGVDEFRGELRTALHGYETIELEQDSLMTLMQDTRRSFDVLVIRTTTALPYTSVFMELQPGYWDGESESRLRRRMRELVSP